MVSLAMSIGVATVAQPKRSHASPWDDPNFSLVTS